MSRITPDRSAAGFAAWATQRRDRKTETARRERERAAERLLDTEHLPSIAGIVEVLHVVARCDAQAALLDAAAAIATNRVGEDEPWQTHVRDWVLGRLVQGPDDTWSGRGNDLRRVEHEGTREAASDIHDALRWGV